MFVFMFLAVLAGVTMSFNRKNNEKNTAVALQWERNDAIALFVCFMSSVAAQWLWPYAVGLFDLRARKLELPVFVGLGLVYALMVTLVNLNRERGIQRRHDKILKVYQSLSDIFGQVDPQDVDFDSLPFKLEEDPKGLISMITIDTTIPGLKINDNSITYAQYALNKWFPELQWISDYDPPGGKLTYRGDPKPPSLALWPGSDYRPATLIPLGLATETEEVLWDIAGTKKIGESSYVNSDGVRAEMHAMSSAPQGMVLGSPLSLDTLVPTPHGYATIGKVCVGDVVFDGNGEPQEVLAVSELQMSETMYRLTAVRYDGQMITVKSDGKHLFPVVTHGAVELFSMHRISCEAGSPFQWNSNVRMIGGPTRKQRQSRKELLGLSDMDDGDQLLWDVKRVDRIPNEIVRCITVSGETHLFLVTDERNADWVELTRKVDAGLLPSEKSLWYPYKAILTRNTGGGKAIWCGQEIIETRKV